MGPTHRLGVESCLWGRARHLDDAERVPLGAADGGGVDVDVRPGLERVAPERGRDRSGAGLDERHWITPALERQKLPIGRLPACCRHKNAEVHRPRLVCLEPDMFRMRRDSK